MLWYPILKSSLHLKMIDKLKSSRIQNVICGEILLDDQIKENFGLIGSGLIIINAPHKFEGHFDKIQHFIAKRLPIKSRYNKIDLTYT